ncbi:MAG: 30S ribosome-binding factor RbfA [Pseudomonadota bacterium]
MRHDHQAGAKGPSQRQLRVGEVIRRALSEILARGDLHEESLSDVSITVTEVRPSPDLRQARVYVMPLGGANADEIVAGLNNAAREIRREVNRSVTLKFSPQLSFVLDQSFDRMDATRTMLAQPDVARDLEK